MLMLIAPEALQRLQHARALGLRATEAQAAAWTAQQSASRGGSPRNMSVADGVAEIRIEGILSQRPDFLAWLFGEGNTTYESIQQALALATADPTIKRVSLYVDSPGGYVAGLFDTLAALEAFEKPISTRAAYACSAAYALASVGGKIEATNEAVQIGSIGVAVSYYHDEDVIDITSTEAPNKRPDPSTPEGKAVIVAELDQIHDLFVKTIARGRGTTVEHVNAHFGRGGVMLAAAAKKAGMIDKIAKPVVRATTVTPAPEVPGSSALFDRLPGETAEAYDARMLAALERFSSSGQAPPRLSRRAAVAAALDQELDTAFAGSLPDGAETVARELERLESEVTTEQPRASAPQPSQPVTAAVVADALERELNLETWRASEDVAP